MSVLVAGSLHLDVVVDAPRLPRIDETLVGSAVDYRFGGKGGNQAVAAARMGAKVAMAGRVGSDRFAEALLEELDAAGVDRTQVTAGPGASGMSVAITDAAGNYGAVIVSAANLDIDAAAVAFPPGTRILCLQNEVPEAANLALARKARAAGARVLLNAAPGRAFETPLLDFVDLLVVNRVEAGDLTGIDAPAQAGPALTAPGRSAVVTLGAEGLLLCRPDSDPMAVPAWTVPVVSTHGAGDMFLGALAAELDRDAALTGALSLAQAAAALLVSTPIANRHEIDRDAVRAFVQAEMR